MSTATAVACVALLSAAAAAQDFRVEPYLQNPASDGITIRWLSETSDAGSVSIDGRAFTSTPTQATTLDYQAAEPLTDRYSGLPWLHTVRVADLQPSTSYAYAVTQGVTTRTGSVVTPITSAAASGLTAGSGRGGCRQVSDLF